MRRKEDDEELPTVYARDLEVELPEERWLVRDLWGRSAVGLVGGAAKSLKSWFGLDLALSVASGTPALDHFTVEAPGRALVYLAEDRLPEVRARLEALCRHRELQLRNLDLLVITQPSLRLDTNRDQKRLDATLARWKPRLLLLDPLVRLHSLDENSAQDISRLLGYFRKLERTFDLAVVVVHHSSKKNHSRPGQALRGSSDLHAFGDSNAYLVRQKKEVILTLEHRAAKAPEPMAMELISKAHGTDIHLKLRAERSTDTQTPSLRSLVLKLLEKSDRPLPQTEIRAQLRVNNQRLGQALRALEKSEEILHTARGWARNNQET
jgi:RecA-family ATPase